MSGGLDMPIAHCPMPIAHPYLYDIGSKSKKIHIKIPEGKWANNLLGAQHVLGKTRPKAADFLVFTTSTRFSDLFRN